MIYMEDLNVIITTSGLGSRLGDLTTYTNKCLIRVADKPTISYLIDSYPDNTRFIITVGHFKSHVEQFLKLVYPNKNIQFVEVDKYFGEGSSLGYSLLKCKPYINGPFIYHASDTIVIDEVLEIPKYNWVAGSKLKDASQYSTIKMDGEFVFEINNKGELNFDFPYIGLSGIKDYEEYFYNLEKLVNSNEFGTDLSDIHVINEMLKKFKFHCKKIKSGNWFDTGNPSSLSHARKSFESNIEVLDKKDESIFFYDNFIIKFFHDSIINKNRTNRGKMLKGLVPDIIDGTENFYKYKKCDGKLFSNSANTKSFKRFLEWSNENLWLTRNCESFKEICYDFYFNKTYNRINKYLNGVEDKQCIINGINVPTILEMMQHINKDWLCSGKPVQFHGDFILDNVIETDNGFCLIDWRQDFGGQLKCGDIYYDLAKLNHNLTINHNIVNEYNYSYSENNCYIHINSRLNECREVLYQFIMENGYDLDKVKILTSIIWINMAGLHEYPFNKFLFNFGKYNLCQNLKTIKTYNIS